MITDSLEHVRALTAATCPRGLGDLRPQFEKLVQHATSIVAEVDRRRTANHGATRANRAKTAAQNQIALCQSSPADIAYREEDGVVVLLPANKDQARDIPVLMARAAELGALSSGVFKFVMPDDVDLDVSEVRVPHTSTFTSKSKDGIHQIQRSIVKEPMEVQCCQSKEIPARDLANDFERTVGDLEALQKMRYCTDGAARTPEERQRLGLPLESPLSNLVGNLLRHTRFHVGGLHSPFAYAAGFGGGIFVLHGEDAELCSLNIQYSGDSRLWITIKPQDAPKVIRRFKKWKCGQDVRHSSVYVDRATLDKWGVSYVSFKQRPREVVFVGGHTLHQGGSLGSSVAEAVNYAPPGWSIDNYSQCKRGKNGCPGIPIPNKLLQFCDPGETQQEQADSDVDEVTEAEVTATTEAMTATEAMTVTEAVAVESVSVDECATTQVVGSLRSREARSSVPKATLPQNDASVEATHRGANPKKRKANTACLRQTKTPKPTVPPGPVPIGKQPKDSDSHCKIPTRLEPPNEKVSRLAEAIQSQWAIDQFWSLIRSRRESDTLRIPSDPLQMAINCATSIRRSQDRSTFDTISMRLNQEYLSKYLEDTRGEHLRNKPEVRKRICEASGMTNDSLKYHLLRGQKWRRLCGPYKGLLSFIPTGRNPFKIPTDDYLELKGRELAAFHTLLDNDHIRALCSPGTAFESSLVPGSEDVEFRGEVATAKPKTLSDSLRDIQPFPTGYTNHFGEHSDWGKPDFWPEEWRWPAKPTAITGEGEQECQFCPESSCDCIRTMFANDRRPKPRIRHYGEKGRGLQAVAEEVDGIAYRPKERIGCIIGTIAPYDPDHIDDWAVELVRPDLEQAGPICSISCAEYGSYFRLLNHCCEPLAKIQSERISGEWVSVVRTVQEIRDREEITISYGLDFFKKRNRPCLCDSCMARGRHAKTSRVVDYP